MRHLWFVSVALAGVGCTEKTHYHPDAAPVGWHDAAVVAELAASANNQLGPTLRGDGLELIFQSDRSGATGCTDLWRATRTTTMAPFGAPTPLDGVNTTRCEGGPTLRADGLELLFFRDTMPEPIKIWRAIRASTSDPFGTPTEVTELNIGVVQVFPSLSADGLTVVFQSATTLGGSMPAYQAERASPTAAFGPPHQLTELAIPQLGVALGGDALSAILYSSSLARLVSYTRASTADAFGMPTTLSELLPDPTYKILGTAFVSSDGKEIFYERGNIGSHVEIWRAIRD